jgi:hypothetical protein
MRARPCGRCRTQPLSSRRPSLQNRARGGVTHHALTLCVGGNPTTRAPGAPVAQAAPPELVSELGSVVERARQRFEARDAPACSRTYRGSTAAVG